MDNPAVLTGIITEDCFKQLYQLGDKIGAGTFSQVHKAVHLASGEDVVCFQLGGYKDH